MPFGLIPFFLLFIPILEIATFILVGGQIGIIATLAMIFVTAIIGSILLRIQGFATFNRIREQTSTGQIPGRELGNGAMILVAGVLLLTPGFVTDTIGFLLFVPPLRHVIWSFLASRVVFHTMPNFNQGVDPGQNRHHSKGDETVVDLDAHEFSEKPDPDSPWISPDDPTNGR